MCLSFVPPFITTCIANEDKRDDKRCSNLPFFHTFPTQHVYFSAIAEVNVCYERGAEISDKRAIYVQFRDNDIKSHIDLTISYHAYLAGTPIYSAV